MTSKHFIILLLAGACILFVGAVGTCETLVAKDLPAAFLPERSFEFQPVPEGTQVTHEFKIQNKGTAPLLISKVRTG